MAAGNIQLPPVNELTEHDFREHQQRAASLFSQQNRLVAATVGGDASQPPGGLNRSDESQVVSFVSKFSNFCAKASIDTTQDIGVALKILFLVSTTFVDRKRLKEELFTGKFVDWVYVENNYSRDPTQINKNPLGDSAAWDVCASFVDFDAMDMPATHLQRDHPPLWYIWNEFRNGRVLHNEANGKSAPKGKVRFADACKLYLLQQISGVRLQNVTGLYLGGKFDRSVAATLVGAVIGAVAGQRHDPEVYYNTTLYLLNAMRVDEGRLADQLAHYRRTTAARETSWRIKHLSLQRCRPSMREVAERVSTRSSSTGAPSALLLSQGGGGGSAFDSISVVDAGDGSTVIVGGVGAAPMTFEAFSDVVRFPTTMSRLLRSRCYLLCACAHMFDHSKHTHRLVTQDVARQLNANPVVLPDARSISAAIETLTMHCAPFEKLNAFRQQCFNSFSMQYKKALTLTITLQLYVAAYMKREIWKQCWQHIFGVHSSIIARDIERFVDANPFAIDDFVDILKNSVPFRG